jgi:hypothetical protein
MASIIRFGSWSREDQEDGQETVHAKTALSIESPNLLKQFRRVSICYEQLTTNSLAVVTSAALMMWSREKGTAARSAVHTPSH